MKSRSHHQRPPTMDLPDWVNGSWTVDCVCGVNFDDGEEMVDCDECGVWVHTRCSHYVKSEKSFTCDKCKNRSSGNECEETEVAQLLVDLPSNTLRMDSNRSLFPPRHPIRLWTQRPMEERVHVQGVPGGEPSLFGGLSSIFTPELWKCSGHVPKKFNFKYREFPCWGEDQSEEENENPVDKGAGVLFSLSKDVLATPVVNTLFHKEELLEGDGCERVAALDDSRKSECGKIIKIRSGEKEIQKDGTLLRPIVFHSGKRKKEDLGTSKEQSVKKKLRLVHKERDSKKRAAVTSLTTSTSPSDAKQSVFQEARVSKIVNTEDQDAKSSDMHTVQSDPFSGDEDVMKNNVDKSNRNITSSVKPQENNDFDVSRQSMSTEAGPKEEKVCHKVYTKTKGSSNAESEATSSKKKDDHVVSLKEEVIGSSPNNLNDNELRSPKATEDGDPKKSKALVGKPLSPILEVTDSEFFSEKPPGHIDKVKTEVGVDNLASVESSTLSDVKIEGTKSYVLHVESTSADNRIITSLNPTVLEALVDDLSADAVGNCQTDVAEGFQFDLSQPIHQNAGCERGVLDGRSSMEFKHKIRVGNGHPSKIIGRNTIPQAPSSQRKVTDNRRISESKTCNSKTGVSNSNKDFKNDKDRQESRDCNIKRDKDVNEMPNKILGEHPKSSLGFAVKNSFLGKVSQACEAKRISSDIKYSTGGSSSKTPSAQNNEVPSGSDEPANSLENQNVSHVRSRISSPSSSLRGEKSYHSNSNSLPMLHPTQSNTSAVLSDEELALLLHQELNSSPRVPRVPRIRSAGSGSQLGSPTGTTTLMRTSSSVGRDQSVIAKRKGKDSPKRRSHSSRDTDDETNDGLLLSPDQRNNKSSRSIEGLPKREGDSVRPHNVKKSANPLSTTTVSSKPFSPSGVSDTKSGSTRHPLRNASDDDAVSTKGSAHQTLPGLLAEIMGKGKRMTYEELCNAVLPHWPHLRKHNGERYAYSTHSQAVLDCLRNRQEWAQLVDRGPKTNGCRKKRKHEIDTPSNESEDDEYGKDSSSKENESRSLKSHRDDVPKGKRKARKRPRLPLKRRRIKDVKRRDMTESEEGDDNGSSSTSSEDSMCSDDEMNQNDMCQNESDTGSSSYEEGTCS